MNDGSVMFGGASFDIFLMACGVRIVDWVEIFASSYGSLTVMAYRAEVL